MINIYYLINKNMNLFLNIYEITLILILHYAISVVYIQTYPAIQAWSPSLLLVNIIGNKKNVDLKIIKKYFDETNLITDRLKDLEDEDLICINNNIITLTTKGKLLSNIFYYYRKTLGLKEGIG
jgi:hypothetical protein